MIVAAKWMMVMISSDVEPQFSSPLAAIITIPSLPARFLYCLTLISLHSTVLYKIRDILTPHFPTFQSLTRHPFHFARPRHVAQIHHLYSLNTTQVLTEFQTTCITPLDCDSFVARGMADENLTYVFSAHHGNNKVGLAPV